MRSFRVLIVRLTAAFVGLLSSLHAPAHESQDAAAIRQVILSAWDTPEMRVTVDPIVVRSTHAVAGWTHGPRGGRALMQLGKDGHWAVIICGGDTLKDVKILESAGLTTNDAKRLIDAVIQAERRVPATRVALFSTFEGLVPMGDHQALHQAARRELDTKPDTPR